MKSIMINKTLNYASVAKETLNATHYRHYFVRIMVRSGYLPEDKAIVFSTHYFNKDDEEVGYTIEDTISVIGLVVFDTPRIWSDEYKLNKNYSKPIDINNYITTNKGYVGENKNV